MAGKHVPRNPAGDDDHKCVDPVPEVGYAFCCRCLQSGPPRETVEEMEADAEIHPGIDCSPMLGDMPDGPPFLPGMTRQRYTQRKTYPVHAQRDGDYWILTVEDVPGAVSQVRDLDDAEAYIREAIAFVLNVKPSRFDVVITTSEQAPPSTS